MCIAERLGASRERDPFPSAIVASVVAVMRSTFAWWMRSDRQVPLVDVLAESFSALASGFAGPRIRDNDPNDHPDPSSQDHHS